MPKVFIIQETWTRGPSGIINPKFDFSAAKSFGALEFLLSPTTKPFRPQGVLAAIREKLADATAEDYLLATGNPVLICMSAIIMAEVCGGFLNVLQWHGKERAYRHVAISFNDAAPFASIQKRKAQIKRIFECTTQNKD